MREFDELGLSACRMQAEAFALSREMLGCSSAVFIRRFMRSRAAQRLDANAETASPAGALELLEEAMSEYAKTSYGQVLYSAEELYWIGYLYRYWSYTCEQASRRVYAICGARELRGLYPSAHTLDPSAAVAQACELAGLPLEDSLASGVRLLREIRSEDKIEYARVEF